jgi:two-component system CheB/CheR fusion protein
VFPLFHYALRPGGFLFLGLAETIGRFTDLFAPLENSKCLYQVREAARGIRVPFSASGAPAPFLVRPPDRAAAGSAPQLKQLVEPRVAALTPAHVVVNAEGEIIFASARTGKYLELPPGVPSRQLLAMAHRDLRIDLRGALREASQSHQTARRENLRFESGDGLAEHVSLSVEPLPKRSGVLPEYLVVFVESRPAAAGTPDSAARDEAMADADKARMAAELRETREQLHSTIEEYETALEELRSANEQMTSLNEEMQSSNEELESSKEELQSLNEEMQTVNQEVLRRADDLDVANAELRDIFVNTRIATIFLDRHLAIRSFTAPAAEVFSILSTDVGRSLTDLTTSLDYPQLHHDLARVLETGAPMELSVRNKDANPRYYVIKITPYADSAKAVAGVVATFIDAPGLARAENTIEKLFSDRLTVIQAMSAGLAHEINQPLQAVSNYLTALRRQVTRAPDAVPEGMAHTLDQAIKQVLRAGRIIHDLRAFIAQNEPDKTILSLRDLIREVGGEFTDSHQPHKLLLRLKLADDADRVLADRTQIDQVLVNLLKNAQESMAESTRRELTIETTRIDQGMVRIDVADTGAGIAREMEGRLFEPFLSTKTRGMGIGLPISRKIVEAHDGKIWVRANPGGGAIFSFTLPLAITDVELLPE